MSKAGIIRDFKVLAQLFTKAKKNRRKALEPGRDSNRYRAYTNAASAICTIPGDVIKSISVVRNKGRRPDGTKAPKREVYVTTNEVTNMLAPPGLGKATTDKIDEYIKTGKIVAAETARAWLKSHGTEKLTPDKHATKVFETIAGVGAVTARAWLKHYNDIPKASRPTPIDWVEANKRRMPTRKKVNSSWLSSTCQLYGKNSPFCMTLFLFTGVALNVIFKSFVFNEKKLDILKGKCRLIGMHTIQRLH
jgi:hypothetical protein